MTTIDKNHEIFKPYNSKCAKCKHFDVINLSCPAFDTDIPEDFLTGISIHSTIVKGQKGDYVFTSS